MECEHFQTAISAMSDGEEPNVTPALVEAHVATCSSCRQFRSALESLPRAAPLAEAPVMPDLSRRVVKLNAMADRAGRWSIVRALLGLIAIEVVVLSVPALVLGRDGASAAHAARHLGAFSVAYAVGLLVVVARPARARAMLPVALVLAGAIAVTAVIDVIEGRIPLVGEAAHIPEILSVWFVWLLARPARDTTVAPGSRMPTGRPALRVVDTEDDQRETG